MNYLKAITLNQVSGCPHGLTPDTCYYCSGQYEKDLKCKRHRTRDLEFVQLKEKYEVLKEKFRNFGELWTEEEINYVYDTLHHLRPKTKEFRKRVYEVSLHLERTTNAVKWVYKHFTYINVKYHRSKTMVEFINKQIKEV